ncbi:MAG: hypothetical protein DI534_01525 [Leifsonia xyli]|nr:MAG: hypothetical protein DI534_01525 [Leifsonia xyli]
MSDTTNTTDGGETGADAPDPVDETPTSSEAAPELPPAPRRRRPRRWIITVVLLCIGLAGAIGTTVWLFLELENANATIRERNKEIKEQKDLIDRKEVFGAAMNKLLDEADGLQGVPIASLVPWDQYQRLVSQAWEGRWNAAALELSIQGVEDARQQLVTQRETAAAAAATNASGSVYETTLDRLGSGYVTWQLDDADTLCEDDVLACVTSDDPLVVHVDAPDDALPYMTDWIRTGLAYHEFAHVLQFTNPEPTESALTSFGEDAETMADCYALSYLDGWTLDHRVWVSSYEYWDVSVGYGYTCDAAQRQVVRDWVGQLGARPRQLSAG